MGEKQNRNMREIYVEIEGNKYRIGEISEITDLKVDFEKPPLGLIPKRFHDKLRIAEIEGAIMRYIESERPIPTEWLEEFLVLRLEEDQSENLQSAT